LIELKSFFLAAERQLIIDVTIGILVKICLNLLYPDHLAKLLHSDRFLEDLQETYLFGFLDRVCVYIGRNGKNMQILHQASESSRVLHVRVERQNLLRRLEAIHHRHPYIHQHEVVLYLAALLRQTLLDLIVGDQAVQGGITVQFELALDHLLDRVQLEKTVINEQNSRLALALHRDIRLRRLHRAIRRLALWLLLLYDLSWIEFKTKSSRFALFRRLHRFI